MNKIFSACAVFAFLFSSAEGSICSVLEKFKQRSLETNSDAVVISRNGRNIFEYFSDECSDHIDSQEMSRSFIPLAYAFLLEDKKIPCLDVPVCFLFPLWESGKTRPITLRDLISNTSGLDKGKIPILDFFESEAFFPVGTRYYRNDKALTILVDIVENITGMTYEDYLFQKLFRPLGIQSVCWKETNLSPMPQIMLSAKDWVRIGNFFANDCLVNGKPLLSEKVFRQLFIPSQEFDPFFGMQWWLEYYDVAFWWDDNLLWAYRCEEVDESIVQELASLEGQEYHFQGKIIGNELDGLKCSAKENILAEEAFLYELVDEVRSKGLPLCRFRTGKVKAMSSIGKGGEQLIIMPYGKWVAVRQTKSSSMSSTEDSNDYFEDFLPLLEQLAAEYDGWVD